MICDHRISLSAIIITYQCNPDHKKYQVNDKEPDCNSEDGERDNLLTMIGSSH